MAVDLNRLSVARKRSLAGLLLAAEPELPRYSLPTVYNYAFRRDRERLPYAIARLLRHGFVGSHIMNIHFVADGKPW